MWRPLCGARTIRAEDGRAAIAGETVDVDGKRVVLTLSRANRHIQPQKCDRHICTNSELCAMGFSAYFDSWGDGIETARPISTTHAPVAVAAERWTAMAESS